MAYSTSNPPMKISQSLAGFNTSESTAAASSVWFYKSADPVGTVNGAGYFSNGVSLGMQVGDPVLVYDTTNNYLSVCFVKSRSVTNAVAGTGTVTLNSSQSLTAE